MCPHGEHCRKLISVCFLKCTFVSMWSTRLTFFGHQHNGQKKKKDSRTCRIKISIIIHIRRRQHENWQKQKNLFIDSCTAAMKESATMALHDVKLPKACRNKKQSVALLTPPDSSLSSSSGSLSSSYGERKQHPKRKTLRYKSHATLIAIPRRKKLKTKKSSSGSDSDCAAHRNNNALNELNRNALYSSCKSFCHVCIQSNYGRESSEATWMCFQPLKSRFWMSTIVW